MPSYKNFFPSADEYLSACGGDSTGRNCIKFALGDTSADPKETAAFNVEPPDKEESSGNALEDLAQAFLHTVNKHNRKLGFSSENFRRIASADAELLPEETYIFKVYGFDQYTYRAFGYRMTGYDFHVMRGTVMSPSEVLWEHKMGWERAPSKVTPGDLEVLEEQYNDKFVYFAFTPPRR